MTPSMGPLYGSGKEVKKIENVSFACRSERSPCPESARNLLQKSGLGFEMDPHKIDFVTLLCSVRSSS
jgi:hypothetical protein